MIERERAET